jgi:hypothetical protein
VARGLCQSHYKQHRKGEPLTEIRRWKNGTDREVFDHYTPDRSDCWEWQGALDVHGYGVMKGRKAHRISYELHKGPTEDKHVLHTCDNPPCVNPDHLYLGDDADNVRDMLERERQNNRTIYSDEVVEEIRRRYSEGERQVDLAMEFGMSQPHVSRLVRSKRRSRH